MVQVEIDEKTAYIQARSSMARTLDQNGKARQAEGKAKNGRMKKLHLENERKLRGIYFIDPEDKEFNETIIGNSGAKVHFAPLMDICHLEYAELEAKHQKYKGRVVFRGDIGKDDSGSYAVFTEQGS